MTSDYGGKTMKKCIHILLLCLIPLCLTGCGKTKSVKAISDLDGTDSVITEPIPEIQGNEDSATPSTVTENRVEENAAKKSSGEKSSENKKSGKIDIDLSDMNYNIMSSLDFDMAIEPEKYYGKTIKMRGQFFTVVEPDSQQRFYYCVVYDPTACCQAGIDFMLKGDKVYPDDFPPEETYIEIIGQFTDFSDMLNDGRSYQGLLCDTITVLDEKNL